jgi:hypothetical protein
MSGSRLVCWCRCVKYWLFPRIGAGLVGIGVGCWRMWETEMVWICGCESDYYENLGDSDEITEREFVRRISGKRAGWFSYGLAD